MMDKEKVMAFVTEIGGPTSHTAILGRSMEIPAVVGMDTVTTKVNDKTLFLVEAKQAGIFEIRNVPDDQMQGIVSIVCPQMVYPYLRAIVSDVCTRAGFPPILLTEVNFQAMFEAQQQQAAAAQGNGGSRIITN